MPYILRDVNPIVANLLTQHHIFYDRAIIMSSHPNASSSIHQTPFRGMERRGAFGCTFLLVSQTELGVL